MTLDRDGDFTDLIHGFLQNGNGDQEIKVLADITERFFPDCCPQEKVQNMFINQKYILHMRDKPLKTTLFASDVSRPLLLEIHRRSSKEKEIKINTFDKES
jgi:hypothetical protein